MKKFIDLTPKETRGLDNYLYKNEVQGYRRLITSQLNVTLNYRNRAVRVYQKLAKLFRHSIRYFCG